MKDFRKDEHVLRARTQHNESLPALERAEKALQEAQDELEARRGAYQEALALDSIGEAADVDTARAAFEEQEEVVKDAKIAHGAAQRAVVLTKERLQEVQADAQAAIREEIGEEAECLSRELAGCLERLLELNARMMQLDRTRGSNVIEPFGPFHEWDYYVRKPLRAAHGMRGVDRHFQDFIEKTEVTA